MSAQSQFADWTASQNYLDALSLALHRVVARRLRENPVLIQQAESNLKRWLSDNSSIGAWLEWQRIFETSSLEKILEIITDETDEGQRLRSSSPFVGLVTAEERRQIMKECEKTELT